MSCMILYGRHALTQDPAVGMVGNFLKTLDDDYFKFLRYQQKSSGVKESQKAMETLKKGCKKMSGLDFILDLHVYTGPSKVKPIRTIQNLIYVTELANENIKRFCANLKKANKLERTNVFELEEYFDWTQENKKHRNSLRECLISLYSALGEYKDRILALEVEIPLPIEPLEWGFEVRELWEDLQRKREKTKQFMIKPKRVLPLLTTLHMNHLAKKEKVTEEQFLRRYGEPLRDILRNREVKSDVSAYFDELKLLLFLMKAYFSTGDHSNLQ